MVIKQAQAVATYQGHRVQLMEADDPVECATLIFEDRSDKPFGWMPIWAENGNLAACVPLGIPFNELKSGEEYLIENYIVVTRLADIDPAYLNSATDTTIVQAA